MSVCINPWRLFPLLAYLVIAVLIYKELRRGPS